jgi:CheY-like chemotaxis protein
MPNVNGPGPLDERRSRVRKRALVVDGDVLTRIETRLLLEMYGYQVDEVNDGLEAIGLLDVEAPKLDLVVLDYEMPLLSGIETLLSMRALQPGLRAFFCVASKEGLRPEKLPERTAFLRKPCTLHGMAEAMDQVHGTTRHLLGHGKVAQIHWIRIPGLLPHYPPR